MTCPSQGCDCSWIKLVVALCVLFCVSSRVFSIRDLGLTLLWSYILLAARRTLSWLFNADGYLAWQLLQYFWRWNYILCRLPLLTRSERWMPISYIPSHAGSCLALILFHRLTASERRSSRLVEWWCRFQISDNSRNFISVLMLNSFARCRLY